MVTRRTLLKQGACATLAAATAPILTGRVFAQSAAPGEFDFYISPTGADSNPGTHDRPWAITAINTHRSNYAGKRVGLLDGTYNVHSLCEGAPGRCGLEVNGGASATSPTVIAAVNARKAILTGADPATGAYPSSKAGAIIGQGYQQVPNKGNVILDGLYLTRGWWAAVHFQPQLPPAGQGGTTGIVVRNCEIVDISGDYHFNPGAVRLQYCSAALIQNNRVHAAEHAGIQSFLCHSNIYEYNTIYDVKNASGNYPPSGIYDKNPQNGNQTVRFNYIENAAGTAMVDCSGGNAGEVVTVHNNILIAPMTWNGSDMVTPSKQSLVFYNNTCNNGGIFYPAGGSSISPPATVKFYNNILYLQQAPGWQGAVWFPAGTVTLSNYNVYRVASGSRGLIGVSPVSAPRTAPKLLTLSDWQRSTGLDSNSIETTVGSGAMFSAMNTLNPNGYALQETAVGRNLGRVGGVASGATTDAGAWGGGATRIGCDFGPSPQAPVLTIK
jgi:Right handed beta helix region